MSSLPALSSQPVAILAVALFLIELLSSIIFIYSPKRLPKGRKRIIHVRRWDVLSAVLWLALLVLAVWDSHIDSCQFFSKNLSNPFQALCLLDTFADTSHNCNIQYPDNCKTRHVVFNLSSTCTHPYRLESSFWCTIYLQCVFLYLAGSKDGLA